MCFSTVEKSPRLECMVFCTVINAEKQTIQNIDIWTTDLCIIRPGILQLAVNVKMTCNSYLSLTNCEGIEVSPVNDLRRHEKYIELENAQAILSKRCENYANTTKYYVTVWIGGFFIKKLKCVFKLKVVWFWNEGAFSVFACFKKTPDHNRILFIT